MNKYNFPIYRRTFIESAGLLTPKDISLKRCKMRIIAKFDDLIQHHVGIEIYVYIYNIDTLYVHLKIFFKKKLLPVYIFLKHSENIERKI